MNTFTLGLRNAFRNVVRSVSIITILGISTGLCLTMLIARQAVSSKIDEVKAAVGTTITISPAGFNNFSDANNSLTTASLSQVSRLPHVAGLTESLTDRLTTIGSAQPTFGRFRDDSNSNAQTSLTSPVTLNANGTGGRFRVFVNGGGNLPANFSLPVSIIGTTDPTKLNNNDATLKSGTVIDGTKDSNDALISTAMASKNNLSIGSTFTAYGQALTVAGIFDTGNQAADGTVVVSLPTLQRLTGQSGAVTNATATVDSLDNLSAATTAVKNALGSGADVQSSQDEANATIQPLQNVASISLVSLIGAIVAGSVIILLTMVMIVRERRREIGILKAIGGSNSRVILQFMSEAVVLTLAGAIVGITIGVIGGNPVTNTLVSSSLSSTEATVNPGGPMRGAFGGGGLRQQLFARAGGGFLQRGGTSLANSVRNISANIGWAVLAEGLAAALVIAVVGSSLAGYMIARVKPYEVMRSE